MTAYYVVEEIEDFFPDDFGNDDAPPQRLAQPQLTEDFWEEPDEFFADDFGNDSIKVPRAPTGLAAQWHP